MGIQFSVTRSETTKVVRQRPCLLELRAVAREARVGTWPEPDKRLNPANRPAYPSKELARAKRACGGSVILKLTLRPGAVSSQPTSVSYHSTILSRRETPHRLFFFQRDWLRSGPFNAALETWRLLNRLRRGRLESPSVRIPEGTFSTVPSVDAKTQVVEVRGTLDGMDSASSSRKIDIRAISSMVMSKYGSGQECYDLHHAFSSPQPQPGEDRASDHQRLAPATWLDSSESRSGSCFVQLIAAGGRETE